jgi:hypothetical protein
MSGSGRLEEFGHSGLERDAIRKVIPGLRIMPPKPAPTAIVRL